MAPGLCSASSPCMLSTALLRHYTRTEVGMAISTSPDLKARNRALCRLESGEIEPSYATLRRLSTVLKCTIILTPSGVTVLPRDVTGAVVGDKVCHHGCDASASNANPIGAEYTKNSALRSA